METFLTLLMALGIYIIFPLIVAAIVCGAVIWGAKLRAEMAKEAKASGDAEGLIHQPART